MFIVDLDAFKDVNDTYGHIEGDKAIQTAAIKLKKLFRANDIVGRLGGDEFCVVAKDFRDMKVLEQKAKKVCEGFEMLTTDNEKTIKITCSAGIAFFDEDGTCFAELYYKADKALYEAKRRGKKSYIIFSDISTDEK
jgi:diguanylate cyclase (GGDEF)-like protein